MGQKNKKAFTLVELIVVITILAILWTVAFISLQSYTKNARDTQRIADINSIEKNLWLYISEKWRYPEPDNWINVTYLWWIAWTQGTVWDLMMKNLKNISKKPVDPLTWNEYAYSVTALKNEYQVWAIQEIWLVENILINQAIASSQVTKSSIAMIKWTYNQVMLKVSTGWIDYILAVPTIINADLYEVDLLSILWLKQLVYNQKWNIPDSYKWQWYNMTGTFNFNPSNIVVYSWSLNDLTSSWSLQQVFITRLQDIYKDTEIWWDSTYKDIMNVVTPEDKQKLMWLYIDNNMWWLVWKNLVINNDNLLSNQWQWKEIAWTNCSNDDIVFTIDWTTYTWAWCNSVLWTTWISTNGDIYNGNCYSYETYLDSPTSTNCDESHMISTAKESDFNSTDWEDNIWWKSYLWANAKQDNNACPTWWHLPTDLEFEKLETYLNWWTNCRNSTDWRQCDWEWWLWKSSKNSSDNFIKALKLPLAWYRYNWSFVSRGLYSYLWTSDEKSSSLGIGRLLYSDNNKIFRFNRDKSIYWFTVRCVKWTSNPSEEEPEVPGECNLNSTQVDNLNNLLANWDILAYDSWLAQINPSTQIEWCNDVYSLEWIWWSSVPSEIWNLVNLDELYLNDNGITEISTSVANLINLSTLSLWWNNLSTLPDELWGLTNLTYLWLNNNAFSEIPSSIWNLTNLDQLYIDNNNLSSIPSTIWNLTQLITLTLNNNNLSNLPVEITSLNNLEFLYLSSNAWLWNLSFDFDINSSSATQVDIPSIWQSMTIWWNWSKIVINTDSPCMTQGELNNLALAIDDSSLSLYSDVDWFLITTWEWFNMSAVCNARAAYWYWWPSIPNELWLLRNLTHLWLDNNSISFLPNWIWDLTVLNRLSISWNNLSDLPAEIWNLSSLQELDLSNNTLTSLPAEIWNLQSLYKLDLSNNSLLSLPSEMTSLQYLLYLFMSNNPSLWDLSYNFDYSYPLETRIWDNLEITCWDYSNIVISSSH